MEFMDRAIELAECAAGGVSPRPPVGAVVVASDGETIVGEGCTQPDPGPHAEHLAIRSADGNARGGTIYSTLEPHQFHGTTPPCTDAIVEAGVARVVCPIADPNPLVNGKGFERLRREGVEVANEVGADQLRRSSELIEGFSKLIRTGMPFVTAKWAMSLDGKVATRSGDSKWITGKEARAHAHRIRYRSDAIVTGIGTVLADDPRLTARDPETDAHLANRPRWRVIVDSRGRMNPEAALLKECGHVIQAVAVQTKSSGMCEIARLPAQDGAVDVVALMKLLADRGCASVLIEAGPTLTASMLEADLVDKAVVYVSTTKIIGGADALSPLAGVGPELMDGITDLHDSRVETLGEDIVITGHVRH